MIDYHYLVEDALTKIHHDLIREHFNKIEKSDAIFVANFEKNGVLGYIGGNTFLEIGLAFYLRKPIYLLNELPEKIGYQEELLAMQPVVIGEDWNKILN
ncbi:MAG: hypothetical protein UX09_C0021G0005 [Candidatus Uhrbacteria bacterium GW2011_GWE2_45_35]|uniref:Maf-like protein n=2 Tax=Candidatus Uhriibacteriota TaxID=1752732 RepID=A0A0G1LRN9_9BACT|nr:MAG: hypothetical protein UW63_C0015G0005 [Candidatus Uhrbacteria bacterium GW2011_GWF2_44_350]KKU08026.1 MAG: hypothetical protein UX09_C0021G0005 [Candidatus Uhrbacteria bacterium GW2011_GWE2_45_35]